MITDAFTATAAEMAGLWGVPDFRYVMIPHPLATLTPSAIDERVDALIGRVLELLKSGQPQ